MELEIERIGSVKLGIRDEPVVGGSRLGGNRTKLASRLQRD